MRFAGGVLAAQPTSPQIEYPKVCGLVLPPQAQGRPAKADVGVLHVYRDALGEMVSLEIEPISAAESRVSGKRVKVRKDKKSDIVKLCLDGYEFAVMGDLPASLASNAESMKRGVDDESDDVVSLNAIQTDDSAKAAVILNVIPSNFSISRINGIYYGNIVGVGTYWTNAFVATGKRPQGKTTQWLTFNMTPNGLSASGDHIAIALFLTSSYTAGIIGNGFIIGRNEAYAYLSPWPMPSGVGGCQSPQSNTQVEAFWKPYPGVFNSPGNATFLATCGNTAVAENVATSYTLHANMYSDVMVQRTTGGVTTTRSINVKNALSTYSPPALNYAIYPNPPFPPHVTLGGFNPDEGGVLIGGATINSSGPNYTMTFTSTYSGWF